MQIPALLAVIAICATVAHSEIISIDNIVLDGFQPAPPTGSLATGLASVLIDTDTRNITIQGSFENLQDDVIFGHLHGPADFGQSSSLIILPVQIEGDFGRTGTFFASERLSQFQLNTVLDSRSYINIHSVAFPQGEIRGQVVVPSPSGFAVLAVGGACAIRRKRK